MSGGFKSIQPSVCQKITLNALEHPSNIAVIFNGEEISYQRLEESINKISNQLLQENLKEKNFIALFFDKSLEMLVSYLAILKIGAVAIPLDIEDPEARIQKILLDCCPHKILTQDKLINCLPRSKIKPLTISLNPKSINRFKSDFIVREVNPDQLAQITYTSGSTGAPKGVKVTHGNLTHYTSAIQSAFKLSHRDNYLYRASISVIASARQLLSPLVSGSTVVMASTEQTKNALKLLKLCQTYGVTIFDHTPSFWSSLIRILPTLKKERLLENSFRIVSAHGENLSHEIPEFWFQHLGERIQYFNLYGQTEGTGVVCLHPILNKCFKNVKNIPIGTPLKGMQAILLDSNNKEVPFGHAAEIHICGNGIASGYFKNDALTNQYFIENPYIEKLKSPTLYKTGDLGRYKEGGVIEYIGRMDKLINFLGRRIELGEIEYSLSQHDEISNAVVKLKKHHSDFEYLIAYIETNTISSSSSVISFLKNDIPAYMIPSQCVFVKNFPVTTSGKVDTQKLDHLESSTVIKYPLEDSLYAKVKATFKKALIYLSSNRIEKPANNLEKVLIGIWEKTLKRKPIGIDDNFFALGGNSLLGVELIIAMESTLEKKLQTKTLENLSTIKKLSLAIQDSELEHQVSGQKNSSHLGEHEFKTMFSVIISSGIPQLAPQSLILKHNEFGSRQPLFWCFNQPGKEMPALSKNLHSDQPLFGLFSTVHLENNHETLVRAASHYVDEITNITPNKEIILGGNCRGAKVICEIIFILKKRGYKIKKVLLLEFFHPELYSYKSDLLFMFGKHSKLERHKLLNWKQPGWEKPFQNKPSVHWIECAHGEFFDKKNTGALSQLINNFLT